MLVAALPGETDARVREAILTGLARIATPESAAAVVPYLGSDDAGLRTGAIDALRAMPAACRPHLPRLLADPDADVRLLSCELTRDLPEGDANRLLCDLLESETEKNVCAAAVEVLAEIGRPEALPVLKTCAERFAGDPFLVFSIKVATDRIGRP
jgi:HEAT repeat protein